MGWFSSRIFTNPFLVTNSRIRIRFAEELLKGRVSILKPPPIDKEEEIQQEIAFNLGLGD